MNPSDDEEKRSATLLRARAEAKLAGSRVTQTNALPAESLRHELGVHQIELEMQNEELQRSQGELDAVNRRYFDLYDLAPVGYCTLSEAGLILQTNLTASTLLGIERSALVQQPFSRLIVPDDTDGYHLMAKALCKSGEAQTVDLRMMKHDGTHFWAHLVANASHNADGALVLRLVLSDVSECKQQENKLLESENRLQTILNQSPSLVYVLDLSGRFTLVNKRLAALFGKPNSAILGRTREDFLPTGIAEKHRANDLEIVRTGESTVFEESNDEPNGRRVYLSTKFPLRNMAGAIVAVCGISTDITERKALESEREQYRVDLEERVKSRTQQFLDLYDKAPCGYHSLSHDGVITRVNKTELALLGYSEEEYVGHRIVEFMTLDSVQTFYDAFPLVLQEGRVRNAEFDFVCKDKSIRTFSVNADFVTDSAGAPSYSLSTMVDITERKRYEQRLELALTGADLGLWDVHVPSGEMHLSAKVCSMLGYTEGGIGTHISDLDKLVHPEDANKRRVAIDAANNGDLPDYRVEYRLRHKEGYWEWVRSRGKIVSRDANSFPLRAVGTIKSISQERRLRLEGGELLQRIESLIKESDKATETPPPPTQVAPANVLGSREQQVIQLIAAGCTTAEIGKHLGISTYTAATHRRNLMRKLNLHTTAELTRFAVTQKLIAD